MIALDDTKAAKVRDYVSYSALSTYQACPLKYYFRYVAQLPEESKSISLLFGSAIHVALENLYRQLLETGEQASLKELAEWYDRAIEHEAIQAGFQFDPVEIAVHADQARRMLHAFLTSSLEYLQGTIVGVEEELRGSIQLGMPPLLARLDLLVETEAAVRVIDFKTSRARWSEGQVVEKADQLLLYGHLVGQQVSEKPVELAFVVLTKTKQPSVEVHAVEVSVERIERARTTAQRVWKAITAEHFYPAPSITNCSTCPYRVPCQSWCADATVAKTEGGVE